MDEPTTQQDSSIKSNKPNSTQDYSTAAIDKFWDSFRFFPKRLDRFFPKGLDEFGYEHWDVLVVALVGIVLIASLTYDKFLNDNFYYSKRFFTSWSIIPLAAALSLVALTFNSWRKRIPTTFKKLKERLTDDKIQQEYLQFLDDYQQTLLNKKKRNKYIRIIIIISFFIAFIATIQAFLNTQLAPLWFRLLAVLFLLLVAVIWGYFFGVGAWGMYITGLYIRRLTSKFDLTIQASHPDKCGGLKIVGDFCLSMALPILVGVILLGTWIIEATLFPNTITGTLLRQGMLIAANSVLFLFALPLAFLAFFLPLWSIHRKMVSKKEANEDAFAKASAQVEKKLGDSLDKGMLEEAKSAKEEMDLIQRRYYPNYPDKNGYPVWPFDTRILLTFLAPQIIAVMSLAIQIGQSVFH